MTDYTENRYRAEVLKWVDGDTVRLRVDLGQHVQVQENYRLIGIDAPETALRKGVTPEEKQAGLDLKAKLEDMIPAGTEIEVQTYKADKYGRWLVRIFWTMADGLIEDLNQYLLDYGLVEQYPAPKVRGQIGQ